jgi:rod shape-determining protein MreD
MASEALSARVWLGRASFALIALLIIFVQLVPLGFDASNTPHPDLLTALGFVVLLRRPDFVPLWLLAPIWFLADILLMRPPGLWTAISLLAFEFTRTQEYRFREQLFALEWAYVAAVLFLAVLANRLLLLLTLSPVAGFGSVMVHYLVTILAYPLVVFFCYFLLRIRKVTPEEAIRFGHRL